MPWASRFLGTLGGRRTSIPQRVPESPAFAASPAREPALLAQAHALRLLGGLMKADVRIGAVAGQSILIAGLEIFSKRVALLKEAAPKIAGRMIGVWIRLNGRDGWS